MVLEHKPSQARHDEHCSADNRCATCFGGALQHIRRRDPESGFHLRNDAGDIGMWLRLIERRMAHTWAAAATAHQIDFGDDWNNI